LRFAVLGDPIAHSRSPVIHTAALTHLGIEGSYLARRAGVPELATAVAELRSGLLHGVNVTMPLKLEAAAAAEVLTAEAEAAQSVNTLRFEQDRIEGHSSDVTASRLAFDDPRFDRSAPILILGSGGAAAAGVIGASGRVVYVSSRTTGHAAAMLQRVAAVAEVVPFGTPVDGAVVFNATPLGLNGAVLPRPVIEAASGLIDLPYGEDPTETVEWALRSRVPVMDGLEVLVLQAADSFRWWTGVEAPLEVMLAAVRKT
jgi:shikimate dehydrogenase